MSELTLDDIDGTGWDECPAPGCERYVGHSEDHFMFIDGMGFLLVYTVMPPKGER